MQVKQVSAFHAIAFIVSVVLGLSLIALWASDEDAETQAAQFGNGLATALASLSSEPLAQKDRIHLGVLVNRLLEIEPVSGVAVYTVDNEMLALSGATQRGLVFTHPVLQDHSIIGYVRLHLDESAFTHNTGPGLFAFSLLLILIVPLGAVALWQRAVRQFVEEPAQPAAVPAAEPPPEPDLEPCYLLVLNLFNQLTLSPRQRDLEVAHAMRLAERIADIYQAGIQPLPGTGLLLTFDEQGDPDRALHVIYAAFVLSQLLSDGESWGHYRLGAHVLQIEADAELSLQAPEIRDTAMLSALAKETTLVISTALKARIPRPERFDLEPLANPLLHELETTEALAWLIRSLQGSTRAIVDQQVREITHSRDASSSESTF
ncbi:MAG: hypothetical protein R3E82_22125 [Pseudomonadales bacterium]|nr:hypothetical protein [Pseudomonadales bacterium]